MPSASWRWAREPHRRSAARITGLPRPDPCLSLTAALPADGLATLEIGRAAQENAVCRCSSRSAWPASPAVRHGILVETADRDALQGL